MIYYFTYGSNLHPFRLMDRVPSAKLVGTAIVTGFQLTFHKKSIDGSGKCNMFETGASSDYIHGAIYSLNPDHRGELDRFEGLGKGYMDRQIALNHSGNQYTCFTYQAQQSHISDDLRPYHWYKQLVILGAEYLDFPGSYIESIKTFPSVNDPKPVRRAEKERLIEQITNFL